MPIVLPEAVDRFDARVDALVRRRSTPAADTVAHAVSSLADRSLLWLLVAALRALRGRPGDLWAAGRMVAVVGVESGVVHGLVKRAFRRERPVSELPLRFGARRPPSGAFPSGHTASATTAAVLLSEGTGWGWALGTLAGAVGWSRVQTRLHHASDVLGGAVLGVAVGLAARRLLPLSGDRH